MKITEIQLALTSEHTQERDGVLAFVRLVFDGSFAVRDIKVMERDGSIYLGMPSRKVTEPCGKCNRKVALADTFCASCGVRITRKDDGREKKNYVDVSHPINQHFRKYLEEQVMEHYNKLVEPHQHLKLRAEDA